jgi:hypothetical protein
MTGCGKVAIVVGSGPTVGISYLAPEESWDSGYCLFDYPPEEVDDEQESDPLHDSQLVCLHCLLEEGPELGRGLDLAREFGEAVLDEDGAWTVAE